MSAMTCDAPPTPRPAVPASGAPITLAPTGAETAKADCPRRPTTLAQLVETAVACEAAGASLIHIHVPDADHRPSLDAVLLRESVQGVRKQTSMVIQLCTGGSVDDSLEEGLTGKDVEPDSATLTWGTTNVGEDVFISPHPFMAQLYPPAQERDGIDGLSAALTTCDSRSWVRRLTEQAAASRGHKPPREPAHADIVDPFGREEEVFATMAQQIMQSIPAVVPALGR
jgi:hypothetical protein